MAAADDVSRQMVRAVFTSERETPRVSIPSSLSSFFFSSFFSSFFLSSSPTRSSNLSTIFLKNDMLAVRWRVFEDVSESQFKIGYVDDGDGL